MQIDYNLDLQANFELNKIGFRKTYMIHFYTIVLQCSIDYFKGSILNLIKVFGRKRFIVLTIYILIKYDFFSYFIEKGLHE